MISFNCSDFGKSTERSRMTKSMDKSSLKMHAKVGKFYQNILVS